MLLEIMLQMRVFSCLMFPLQVVKLLTQLCVSNLSCFHLVAQVPGDPDEPGRVQRDEVRFEVLEISGASERGRVHPIFLC